jgi:hypothetical protein
MKSGDCIANKIRSGLWSGRSFLIVPPTAAHISSSLFSLIFSLTKKNRPKAD